MFLVTCMTQRVKRVLLGELWAYGRPAIVPDELTMRVIHFRCCFVTECPISHIHILLSNPPCFCSTELMDSLHQMEDLCSLLMIPTVKPLTSPTCTLNGSYTAAPVVLAQWADANGALSESMRVEREMPWAFVLTPSFWEILAVSNNTHSHWSRCIMSRWAWNKEQNNYHARLFYIFAWAFPSDD